MANAILTSAKRGAYVAIGLYLALVLVVSVSAQTQHSFDAPIQVAHPGIQFEHRSQQAAPDSVEFAGVVGL